MYVIFIHISGIAVIEILFYFFYIGEMETQMFIHNINHLLKMEERTINYDMYNGSLPIYNTTFIDYYQIRAKAGEDKREKANYHLFSYAMLGFIVILAITFAITFIEFYVKKKNVRRVRSMDSVRNICLEMAEYTPTQTNAQTNTTSEVQIEEKENKIMIFVIHSLLYAGLLIAFEYWFFNCIIMKYKVISNEEIEYLFAKQLDN